jgi:hypothetical protein
MLSSRKENKKMVQPQKVGALVILNCREKIGLLVTKFILSKVNSKVLLEKVLNGLRIMQHSCSWVVVVKIIMMTV